MVNIRALTLALTVLLTSQVSVAQTSNSAIFRFLDITPSARSAALGGNHVALFDANSSMIYINPAYMTPQSAGQVSATFVNTLSDSKLGFANGAFNVENVGTIGLGVRYAGYGDFDLLTENGEDLGNFNAGDFSLTSALSTQLYENLYAGAGIDFIYSSYHIYNSSAITASAGLYYLNHQNDFSAGLAIRNFGDQLDYYDGTGEKIPMDVSLGISKKPENFPFHLHLTFRQLNNWDMRIYGESERPGFFDNFYRHVIFGGEAALGDNFRLRFGYNRFLHEQNKTKENFDFAGVSIGAGINIRGFIFDISRSSYSQAGGILQLSVSTQL